MCGIAGTIDLGRDVRGLAGLPELPDADGDGIPDSAEQPES